jgi:hypothetical protein
LVLMTGNVVTSEVDAIIYVVLNKAKKTRALWGISWYQRTYSAIAEVSHKRTSLQPRSSVAVEKC